MTKAILVLNGLEFSVLNPTSFIVPKSKSMVHQMAVPLFGDLHLHLKIKESSISILNNLGEKGIPINGKISVFRTKDSGDKKLYDIEFEKARLEVFLVHYDQEEQPVYIEICLMPRVQKVGNIIVNRGLKPNLQSKS